MRVTYVKSFIPKTERNKPLCRYKISYEAYNKMVSTLQCQPRCTLLTVGHFSLSAGLGELCGSECIQANYTVKS